MNIPTGAWTEGFGGPPAFVEAALGLFAIEAASTEDNIFRGREEQVSNLFAYCMRLLLHAYNIECAHRCVMVEQRWYDIPKPSSYNRSVVFSTGCAPLGRSINNMSKHPRCDIYVKAPIHIEPDEMDSSGTVLMKPRMPIVEREHYFIECKVVREGGAWRPILADILRVSLFPVAARCSGDRRGSCCLIAVENEAARSAAVSKEEYLAEALSENPHRYESFSVNDLSVVSHALADLSFTADVLICKHELPRSGAVYLLTFANGALFRGDVGLTPEELGPAVRAILSASTSQE